MYVKRIESNIKGGVDAELGPLTLIVGPSGSAKTSAWNALELVFIGGCSDVGAYEWRGRPRDLLDELAPVGASKLWAKATLSDGRVASNEIARNKKTGGAKKAIRKVPVDAVLPVHPFRAGLKGNSATVRAFLLHKLAAKVTAEDVYTRIAPADILDAYKTVEGPEDDYVDPSPLGRLLTVRSTARERHGQTRKAWTEVKNNAKTLAADLDPCPTAAQVAAAEKAVEDARSLLAGMGATLRGPTESDVQQAYQRARAAITAYREVETRLVKGQDVEAPDPRAAALCDSILRVTDATVESGIPGCAVCMTPLDAAKRAAIAAARARIAETRDAMRTAQQAAQERSFARSEAKSRHEKANIALAAYRKVKQEFDASAGKGDAYYEAVADHGTATTALAQTRACLNAWERVNAAKEAADDAKAQMDQWDALATACDGAVASLLDSTRVNYVQRVNEHLPPDDVFDLILREQRGDEWVDTCRFGLLRDGRLLTALSGAEMGRVVAAMVAATLTGEEELAIVTLPRDVAMDRRALRATMVALSPLSKLGAQVVLLSVIGHAGKRPAGWTVVNVTADGKAKTSGEAS